MRFRALSFIVSLSCLCVCAAPKLRIGVFDTRLSGGQGVGPRFPLEALRKQGYDAQPFANFSPLTLAQFDILWLADMHHPGSQQDGWEQRLEGFIEAGGGVLQTWHHHRLQAVGHGVRRVFGSRKMIVLQEHPALQGLDNFQASYKDHIVEHVGPQGTVLVKNEFGDAVVVAGKLGKGKVVSTGLALAIAKNRPRGQELELVKRLLVWLTPDASLEERMAGLGIEPSFEVSPAKRRVAAGFPAAFSIATAGTEGTTPKFSLDGKPLTLTPKRQAQTAKLQFATYDLEIPSQPGKNAETTYILRVENGKYSKELTLTVQAIHAPPATNEYRGVWLHVGMDRHPAKVMPELKALGLNMAVLRIAGGTAAFYASKLQPDVQDPLAKTGGDWLAESLKHAHANGIELHPYVNNCIVEGRTSPESLERLRQANRLQKSPEGNDIAWFCPSSEENLKAIVRPMLEIASNYDVDGLQYDFIRYPNSQGCFCPRCRALFEKETAKAVADWPKDVLKGGKRYDEWIEFRCRRISAIVERVSTKVRQANPKVKISAAVFRDWPRCRETNGQDWTRWCREGWLDFVCPMNYTNSDDLFLERCITHEKALPENFPVLQGIGITSGNSHMENPGQALLQIMLARQHGAGGFVGFCYKPEHTMRLFTPLIKLMD